jgi:hypothetical protein
MVTETDLKPIVNDLLDAFPMFASWFAGLSQDQRDGMKRAWTRQLSKLEPSDVRHAADQILDGRVPLPKNYEFDRLGFELRSWGQVAAAERIERGNTETLRQQAQPIKDSSARAVGCRFGKAIKCASAWGAACRAGYVEQNQNEDAMVLIHRFHQHGDVELVWPDVPAGEQKTLVDFWKS